MPNIQIHGMGIGSGSDLTRSSIINACKGAEYASELVVETCHSSVTDLKGRQQPYLKIVAPADSLDKHLDDILKRLEPLNMDTEVGELRRFIPKKS